MGERNQRSHPRDTPFRGASNSSKKKTFVSFEALPSESRLTADSIVLANASGLESCERLMTSGLAQPAASTTCSTVNDLPEPGGPNTAMEIGFETVRSA